MWLVSLAMMLLAIRLVFVNSFDLSIVCWSVWGLFVGFVYVMRRKNEDLKIEVKIWKLAKICVIKLNTQI